MAQRNPQATRERIDNAALQLFAKHGVAEVGLRDIAREADCAVGAIYRHVPSKEALAVELVSRHATKLSARLRQTGHNATGFSSRIGAFIRELCRYHDSDPESFRLIFISSRNIMDSLPTSTETPFSLLHDMLLAGMATGNIPERIPHLLSGFIWGQILETACACRDGRLKPQMMIYCEELAASCWFVCKP